MDIFPLILFGYSPGGVLVFQKDLHAFCLLLLAYMHEELEKKVSIVSELALETADAFYTELIGVIFKAVLKHIACSFLHPA